MLTFWPLCKRLLCHLDAVNWIPQWFRVSRVLGYLLPSGLTLYIYLSNTASGSKRVFWRSSQWRVALLWGYICLVHRLSNKPVYYTDVFRQENSAPNSEWIYQVDIMSLPQRGRAFIILGSLSTLHCFSLNSCFSGEVWQEEFIPFLQRSHLQSQTAHHFSKYMYSDSTLECSSCVLPFIWGTRHIHYIFLNEWWFFHMCMVCRGKHSIQERKQCRVCHTLYLHSSESRTFARILS